MTKRIWSIVAICVLTASAASAEATILGPDAAACRPGSGRDALLLTVDGFRSRDGNLRVELWPATEGDFMRNHNELVAEGLPYHRVTVSLPPSGPARVCVPLPGPGTYAVGAFHSPTGQRKFNFRSDGATFTRNPRIGTRQPRAEDVAVTYGRGLTEQHVVMNYLRGLSFRPLPQYREQAAQR